MPQRRPVPLTENRRGPAGARGGEGWPVGESPQYPEYPAYLTGVRFFARKASMRV